MLGRRPVVHSLGIVADELFRGVHEVILAEMLLTRFLLQLVAVLLRSTFEGVLVEIAMIEEILYRLHRVLLRRPVLVRRRVVERSVFRCFQRSPFVGDRKAEVVFRPALESSLRHVDVVIDDADLPLVKGELLLQYLVFATVVPVGEDVIFHRATEETLAQVDFHTRVSPMFSQVWK